MSPEEQFIWPVPDKVKASAAMVPAVILTIAEQGNHPSLDGWVKKTRADGILLRHRGEENYVVCRKMGGTGIMVLSKTDHIPRQMYIFSHVRNPRQMYFFSPERNPD